MKTRLLLLAFLAALAIGETRSRFGTAPGVDFYHLWGVGEANRYSEQPLGSPYANTSAYAAALNARADAGTADTRFEAANQRRRELDLTGSPLLYTCFRLLPSGYSTGFALFQGAQLLALLAAVMMLGRLYGVSRFETSALGLLLSVAYWPFLSDLRVGNLSSMQLAALTLFAVTAARDARGDPSRPVRGLFLAGLVLLVMLKPTIALVAGLLALQLFLRRPSAIRPRAMAPSVLVAALGFALPCFVFGSWSIWADWIALLRGRGGFPIHEGNHSTPLMLSDTFGLGAGAASGGVLVVLALSAAIAVWRAGGGFGALGRVWRDPMRTAAIAIVVTLALSRLAWAHYFVLALLPALWLFWSARRSGAWLAAVAIGLTSSLLGTLVEFVGWNEIVRYAVAASWLPLWIGILTAPFDGDGR